MFETKVKGFDGKETTKIDALKSFVKAMKFLESNALKIENDKGFHHSDERRKARIEQVDSILELIDVIDQNYEEGLQQIREIYRSMGVIQNAME